MKTSKKGLPWRRLWNIGKPFWVSEMRGSALLQLGLVLILLFANARLAVYLNELAGHLSTSIEQKSITKLYHYALVSVGAFVVCNFVQVFYDLMRTRLSLTWRKWLSTRLFSLYFANRAYLKLLRDKEIDNPDQRMTEDVDSFCNSSVGLFISILDAVVNIALFAGVLWSISPTLAYTDIGYAAGGSLIVVLIGKALVSLNFNRLKREADLRFCLVDSRREAESIARFNGESIVEAQAGERLKSVIETLLSIMLVNRNIQIFTGTYNRIMPLIPAVMIAPLYVKGLVPFGDITRAAMAFTSVFHGATFIISQFGGISTYAAIINRIGSFIESMEEVVREEESSEQQIEVVEGPEIIFENVSILTPDLTKLAINNFSMKVEAGEKLLICGPDGSGKHALLQSLAGIVTTGSGTLTKPACPQMMFLGQNFYMPRTTLREAICIGPVNKVKDSTRIHQALVQAGLADLVKRAGGLESSQSWRTFLSANEQQRLGFARVFYNRPSCVILDEATSALDQAIEKHFYKLLSDSGATVISIGSNPALTTYHDRLLSLSIGGGHWQLDPIIVAP